MPITCTTKEYISGVNLRFHGKRIDDSFIQRFVARHKEEPAFENIADINEHVLVYHRGVGLDWAEQYFFSQKVTDNEVVFIVLLLLLCVCVCVCVCSKSKWQSRFW